MSKLVVFGGAGFLGRRICQGGVDAGYQVTSLTRSGKPPSNCTHHDARWLSKVQWRSADMLNPKTYKHELEDAQTVVHSVGILLENQNYKTAINSNSNVLSEFVNFIKPSNPMTKTPYNSYDTVNRDSAILLAETFIEQAKTQTPTFVYISADKGFPGLPSGYIRSKREAEMELSMMKQLRTIFARPGFMFDEELNDNTMRDYVHKFVDTMDWSNKALLGGRISVLNDLIRPTVSTQTVAKAIISKVNDPMFHGVLGLDDMLQNY